MDRRAFIGTLTGGLLAAPLTVEAQQARRPIIGVTLGGSQPNPYGEALRLALAERGWIDGQNVRIEYRYAEGRPDRYPGFFAELLRLNVDVIVAGGGTVAASLAASLARPGGNVTGFSMQIMEIGSKKLDLLKEVFPKIERVAALCDAADASEAGAIEAAAPLRGSQVQVLRVSRADEFEGAFQTAKRGRAQALIVCASGFFTAHLKRLVDLAGQSRLAAIYEHRDFPNAGGLMSYGPSIAEMYRQAATYVDKILKGAKPSDLPIEQPTKFELVINLKTAKALGLTIPQSLLQRADQVIE
jgi:putative ABC transport system substrate-binding protein